MKTLEEMIREARRELRRVSGVPLTPAEIDEERRATEMEAMNRFMLKTFRLRLEIVLVAQTVWTEGGAALDFTPEGRLYRLRKGEDRYILVAVNHGTETELISLDPADEHFASRVLVAIGDDMMLGSEVG